MKLSNLLKPRIKRHSQLIGHNTVMTNEERLIFKEECQSKPSQLLQELRDVMPEEPIQDYAHFIDTDLYKAMLEQAEQGNWCLTLDEILSIEFEEWVDWIREQGLKTDLDRDFSLIIRWKEK